MNFDLKNYLVDHRKTVNDALVQYIGTLCDSSLMRASIEYTLIGHGKRVRPILCIAAYEAVTESSSAKVIPIACALEMIHTYSLIHDDLPALDNDQMRRGRPACHVQFGESTAILCGDALLNMAFELFTESALTLGRDNLALWIETMALIAKASGCRGMIEGQARDLAFEGVKLDLDALRTMHALKTGALIKAAIKSGALSGDASDTQISALTHYAECIGLAFQVADDVLNVKGDPTIMGKTVGSDSNRHKNTYPALIGLVESERYARALIDDALQSLELFDRRADPLRALARFIVERNR